MPDFCAPGRPDIFKSQLNGSGRYRKVPAEYFEHLHLVNLQAAFRSIRLWRKSMQKPPQVLALLSLCQPLPTFPFRN